MQKVPKPILATLGLSAAFAVYFFCYQSAETETETVSTSASVQPSDEIRKSGYLKFRGEQVQTEYPGVLDTVRKFTTGPSDEPYNLTRVNNFTALEFLVTQINEPWVDVAILMETLLPKDQPRYFLECGANNGEIFSNTLYLEKYRGWTGLLIEADPIYFADMTTKHRKAVQVEACASPHNHVSIMSLRHSPFSFQLKTEKGENVTVVNPGRGYLDDFNLAQNRDASDWTQIDVLCIPIYHIMLASHMTSFDFVVLDAEGAELSILETIPFDKVDMKFLFIEMVKKDHKERITALLTKKNYTLHAFYAGGAHPRNGLFIRNDLYDEKKIKQEHDLSELYELLIGDKNASEVSPSEQLTLYSVLEFNTKVVIPAS